MKVADIMRMPLFTVSPNTPLSEVRRLIFSLGISGILVQDEKKVVGIIGEEDIAQYIAPKIKNVLEENETKAQKPEKNSLITEFLQTPAKTIMNTDLVSVAPETSLLEAYTIMIQHNFSRLPVIDTEKNLLGIISQGDVLRSVMKPYFPKLHEERYAKFVAEYHDSMVDWEARFEQEFPALLRIFKKEKIENVLDLEVWTGEYSIELIKRGAVQKLVGLDDQVLLVQAAQKKLENLSKSFATKIQFQHSNFENIHQQLSDKFDAVLLLGNALPYIPVPTTTLFNDLSKVLNKNGVVILQVINYKKLIEEKNGLLSFKMQPSIVKNAKKHLFVEFVNKIQGDELTHNIVTLDFDGKTWTYKGMNSIPIHYLSKEDIEKSLKEAGFEEILIGGNVGEYQGDHGKMSFVKPFDPEESDWLNIVAKKK